MILTFQSVSKQVKIGGKSGFGFPFGMFFCLFFRLSVAKDICFGLQKTVFRSPKVGLSEGETYMFRNLKHICFGSKGREVKRRKLFNVLGVSGLRLCNKNGRFLRKLTGDWAEVTKIGKKSGLSKLLF